MFSGLKKDIDAVRERDPAAPGAIGVLILYPGLHAIMWHRPAHWLWERGFCFTAFLFLTCVNPPKIYRSIYCRNGIKKHSQIIIFVI